jgi:Domain of unknown function (DUF4145)
MVQKIVPPTFQANAFNCPHCGAYAQQEWSQLEMTHSRQGNTRNVRMDLPLTGFDFSYCKVCRQPSLWVRQGLVWPSALVPPPPAEDCPPDVKVDYDEARNIFQGSPKASAALLRLAIQKLCVHLGRKGKDLNGDIGELVRSGLPIKIQQALDIVRVTGNNAVHPGEIKIDDDPEIALNLFFLVNVIIENMITQPRQISEKFGSLPEGAREQIERRDGSGSTI